MPQPVHCSSKSRRSFQAINSKNQIVDGRFRNVTMFNIPQDWLADIASERKPKELAKRMALINEKQSEIYKLAKLVTRKIVVRMRDK
jgi:hypothetical protein